MHRKEVFEFEERQVKKSGTFELAYLTDYRVRILQLVANLT
jgi:hypothetical protein